MVESRSCLLALHGHCLCLSLLWQETALEQCQYTISAHHNIADYIVHLSWIFVSALSNLLIASVWFYIQK